MNRGLGPIGVVEGNGGAAWVLVHDRFSAVDARRSAELDKLVHGEGACRYCRAKLSDSTLSDHPGVCAKRACIRLAKAAQEQERAATVATLAEPAVKPPSARPDSTTSPAPVSDDQECMMLCKNCKKNELRANNRSGWCTPCRMANGNRVPADGRARPARRVRPTHGPSAAMGLPAVEDLPDEFLVLCVKEARTRRDRIQAEAAERMQMLEKALAS